MYNILDQQDLNNLKEKEPQRFNFTTEGGFHPHTQEIFGESENALHPEQGVGVYFNLKGLELAPMDGINVEKLNHLAKIVRGFAFAAIDGVKSGHPGGSSSKIEQILALLFSGVLAFDPMEPKHPGRDRIVWSAGHCTPLLHSTLALIYHVLQQNNQQIDKEAMGAVFPTCLARFRHCDGPSGHVESRYALSDASTGSSGHGFSAGLGLAMLQKTNGLDSKVFVIAGDAETEEGMSYEARNTIVSMGADNMIVTLDNNNFGIDGPITDVISTPYVNHWFGLGWNVIEVDGHNVLEVAYAYKKAAQGFGNGKPTVVICHTIKGKDYGKLAGTADCHGMPAPHPEYIEIMKNLGFEVPGVEGETSKDIDVVTSKITRDDMVYIIERLEENKKNLKSEKGLLEKMSVALKGRPMVDYRKIRRPEVLPPELVFAEGDNVPIRKATEAFFKWLMGQTAFFYAGSGDLAKSILTTAAENVYGIVSAKNPLGRGFRFGIAEQNMAMMSTTMTQDILPGGFQAMSVFSTYGVFTSIMANPVRMALVSNEVNPKMKGFFVMLAAHDGPETGEDGPTHQGLFWMSLFDAYPGIKVYKPSDANEAIEMLFSALEKGEPIALSVLRPPTPVFKRGLSADGKYTIPAAREAINGAYAFKPFALNGRKKVALVICGGQVLANVLTILPDMEKELDVKIIAVTSPEVFEEWRRNNPEKANEVLPDQERQHVVVLHNGWSGFLYRFLLPGDYEKKTIEIDRFLKAGPPSEVYKLAKFDVDGIKDQIFKSL